VSKKFVVSELHPRDSFNILNKFGGRPIVGEEIDTSRLEEWPPNSPFNLEGWLAGNAIVSGNRPLIFIGVKVKEVDQ
jgi:hypothetical protein